MVNLLGKISMVTAECRGGICIHYIRFVDVSAGRLCEFLQLKTAGHLCKQQEAV